MNNVIKLVVCGWGVEFGRYFCGGAPGVPVIYYWGVGLHWRTCWDKEIAGNWVWRVRYWYSAYQHVPTFAEEVLYRERVNVMRKKSGLEEK
jgi:hypothetical protein